MLTRDEVMALALETGFTQAGWVKKEDRELLPEVIKMCEQNTCRCYNTNWCCPPALGTLEECQQRVNSYEHMLIFSRKGELEDSLDFEGMQDAAEKFRETADIFHEKLRGNLSRMLMLTNGGCHRCKKCTYPDAPCRFPEMSHGSLEGTGFMVSVIAGKAGINYINGKNTITYFGAVLFD